METNYKYTTVKSIANWALITGILIGSFGTSIAFLIYYALWN